MIQMRNPQLLIAASLLLGLGFPLRAETLSLKEVAPGIFVHQGVHEVPDAKNRGEIANIGFVVGEHCVAVIDSGGNPDQGRELRDAIAQKTRVPICYVINTHVHPDHIYGNQSFRLDGVRFVGHHKLAQAMALRAPYYSDMAHRDLGITLTPEDFVPPDLPVQGTLELDLGGRTLELTAHPTAHTDNDLSILDTKTRTLWLADLLFMGHLPVIDGSLLGWLREIERLRQVQATQVIPGHGPVTADWPLALTGEENYLKSLANEIRIAIQSNKTIEQAMNEVGQKNRPDWQLFDAFHKRNVAAAFAELEWEEESTHTPSGALP
jgi:quinoprotein relay system zinc metallohydrolase 2